MDDAERKPVEGCVVHLVEASLSFFFLDELKVAVAAGLVGLGVNDDLGVLDLVALVREELVEVEIEEALLGQVAHVETGHLVHSLLALLLALLVVALGVGSVATYVQILELVDEHSLGVRGIRHVGVHAGHLRADLRRDHSWHSHRIHCLLSRERSGHHNPGVVHLLTLH